MSDFVLCGIFTSYVGNFVRAAAVRSVEAPSANRHPVSACQLTIKITPVRL